MSEDTEAIWQEIADLRNELAALQVKREILAMQVSTLKELEKTLEKSKETVAAVSRNIADQINAEV